MNGAQAMYKQVMVASIFLSLTLISACTASTASNSTTAKQQSLTPSVPLDPALAYQELQQRIGSAPCTQNSQCLTMGVGYKACGGPESYLVYSTQTATKESLTPSFERYNQARKAQIQASGRVSNCMLTPDPGAQCIQQRCALAASSR
jgi:hypothetical protein